MKRIPSSVGLLTAALSLTLLLSACGISAQPNPPVPPASPQVKDDSSQPAGSAALTPAPPETTSQPLPDQSGTGDDEASQVVKPVEPPADPVQAPYDFSQPAPEREAVDNSYFSDAAFVGDSRTDGFMLYSGIGTGDSLTSNGLSIFKLAKKKAVEINGNSYTLLEALALKEYGKVYLSLGINELGYADDEGFYRAYSDAIDAIRAAQPNAVIYIQNLIPLNEEVIAATGGKDYLTNEHLRVYNELMRQVAQEKQVVYLDVYSAFADENDQLPAEASKDGVHLKSDYCKKWLEYLKTHTVELDTDPQPADSKETSSEAVDQ